jgi:hypothetical protein
MTWLVSPQQCYIIGMIAFGIIGFFRGWRREVVSLAFTLTGILFLLLKGGDAVAQIVFVKMPIVIHDIFGTGPAPVTSQPTSQQVLIVSLITFVVFVAVGYIVGNRVFPDKNPSPATRLLGVLPGLVTGYFIITYLANIFAGSPLITLGIGTPAQNLLTSSVPVLILVAIGVAIAGLIASRSKKSGAGGKK